MTPTAILSHTEIARHAARGRLLQGRAVRSGLRAALRLVLDLARGVLGRRAVARRSFAGRAFPGRTVRGPGNGCGAPA